MCIYMERRNNFNLIPFPKPIDQILELITWSCTVFYFAFPRAQKHKETQEI